MCLLKGWAASIGLSGIARHSWPWHHSARVHRLSSLTCLCHIYVWDPVEMCHTVAMLCGASAALFLKGRRERVPRHFRDTAVLVLVLHFILSFRFFCNWCELTRGACGTKWGRGCLPLLWGPDQKVNKLWRELAPKWLSPFPFPLHLERGREVQEREG